MFSYFNSPAALGYLRTLRVINCPVPLCRRDRRPLPATLQSTAPANTDDTSGGICTPSPAPLRPQPIGPLVVGTDRARSDDTRQPLCPVARIGREPTGPRIAPSSCSSCKWKLCNRCRNAVRDTDGGSDSSAAYSRSESVTSASRPPRSYSSRQMMVRKRSRSTWQTFVAAAASGGSPPWARSSTSNCTPLS